MRVWRDIPPARAWETLLQPVIQSLKNRDTQALMSSLLDAIKVYDLLRKDAVDTLEDRARLLDIIAEKADELFATAYKYHVDQVKRDTKAGKAALKAQGLTSSAFYVKGDHKIPLAALSRRARTKAGYLRALAAYYRVNADGVNPQAFLDRVFRAPQVKQGKSIGLVPGVRLEGIDPAGRGWEVTWDPGADDITVANSMGIYAKRWLTALRRDASTPPLFVWLEAQEVCRNKDEAGQVNTVKMVGDEELKSTVWTVRVTDGGVVQQGKFVDDGYVWQPFDTQWVTGADSDKGKHHTLAYVWTTHKELYCELHNPRQGREWDSFHHSSFLRGGLVLCAGMIGARQGKIIFVNNNSGHYQPTPTNLQKLVKHLHKRGAFSADAVVELAGQENARVGPAEFAARALAAPPAAAAAAAAAPPAAAAAAPLVPPAAAGQAWVRPAGARQPGVGNAPGIGARRGGQ